MLPRSKKTSLRCRSRLTTRRASLHAMKSGLILTVLPSCSDLVQQLSDAYRADAEAVCGTVCLVLETTVAGEGRSNSATEQVDIHAFDCAEPVLRISVYVGRISQELTTSSHSFTQIGCGEAATRGRRDHTSRPLLMLTSAYRIPRTFDCAGFQAHAGLARTDGFQSSTRQLGN